MSAQDLTAPNRFSYRGGTAIADRRERTTLSVMLADGDALALQLVTGILRDAPDLVVVANAADACDATARARRHRPDVLIIESALPEKGGVEVIRDLDDELPEMHVLMLCAHTDEDVAVEALRAGAIGYLTKDVQPADLPHVVRKIARGEPVIPPWLLPRLLQLVRDVPDAGWRPVRSRLTTREWEIVELLEDGASTDHIAEALVVSPSTVYSHVKSLMRKLRVHSRKEAVAVAQRLRREEIAARPGAA